MSCMSKSFPKEKRTLLQGYLNEYCLIERNLSKTTIKNKKYALARLFHFLGDTPLNIKNCRKYTVHTLRHIFCTSLLKRGVSLQIVSRLMRHSNVGITDKTYSHYLVEDLSLGLNKHPLIKAEAY